MKRITITYDLYGRKEELTASPDLLCHLSIALRESADWNDDMGAHATANRLRMENERIYKALEDIGYYDVD